MIGNNKNFLAVAENCGPKIVTTFTNIEKYSTWIVIHRAVRIVQLPALEFTMARKRQQCDKMACVHFNYQLIWSIIPVFFYVY